MAALCCKQLTVRAKTAKKERNTSCRSNINQIASDRREKKKNERVVFWWWQFEVLANTTGKVTVHFYLDLPINPLLPGGVTQLAEKNKNKNTLRKKKKKGFCFANTSPSLYTTKLN